MAVQDLWRKRDGSPAARAGRGMRWRVTVPGYPASSYRTKAEADLVHAQRIAAGPPRPENTITVGDLLTRWLASKTHLATSSQEACRVAARKIRPQWNHVVAVTVTRPMVAEWLAGLTVSSRDGEVRAASRSVRAKTLQALSGSLQIGVDIGALPSNPCHGLSAGRAERRAIDVLEPAEVSAMAASDPDYRGLYWLLATCGLRISEAAALNVGDIDKTRRRLVVRKSKTRSAREIPISKEVLSMLDLGRPPDAPLFVDAKGGNRLAARSWARWRFARAAAAAGRPGVTPHIMRHTAASWAIRSGADVKAVQRMLGHATAAMTLDRYGHLWDRGLDDVGERMGGFVE